MIEGKKNDFDRRVNSEKRGRQRERERERVKRRAKWRSIEGVRMIDNKTVHNVTLIFVNLSFLCNNSDLVVNDDDFFLYMCVSTLAYQCIHDFIRGRTLEFTVYINYFKRQNLSKKSNDNYRELNT